LAAARAQGARIDTSFYLYVLGRAGIDESALTAIQQFVTESHADPNAATIDLLEGFGLNPVYDREAGLQSLDIVLPPG
jgi:hypothetical protein